MFLLLGLACIDPTDPTTTNDNEFISTVDLVATGSDGSTLAATWDDEQGNVTVDTLTLVRGVTYTVAIAVWNGAEDPAVDMTPEISAEADEHQYFFYGDAIEGPANPDNVTALVAQSYIDEDSVGFPVGLEVELEGLVAGSADMTLLLRHMPPEDGTPVKTGELAALLAKEGEAGLPGSTDIAADFPVEVLAE